MALRQADAHVEQQETLLSLIPAIMAQAWPLIDVHDLRGTLPRFTQAVQAIVARFGQASAVAALDYYRGERASAGVAGSAPVVLAPSPADAIVEDAVRGATADLWGPVTPDLEQAAQDRLAGEVVKLVADQARQSITASVDGDPAARGWARVPNADACSFCLMVAQRGAAYKSAKAAGRVDARKLYGDDAKGYANTFHPNCRCQVEPLFADHYEPTARVREAAALWKTATKGRYGADARIAFRQAVEGRPVVGQTRKPFKRSA